MKNIYLFLIILLSTLTAYNQGFNIDKFTNWTEKNPGKLIPIRIEFNENIDCFQINQQFRAKYTPLDKRSKILNKLLLQQSNKSQKPVLDFLKSNSCPSCEYRSFWIVNIVFALVDLNNIRELYEISTINSIEIEESQFIPHPEFNISSNNYRTPNGVENGLVAINAPAMWNLGYTGRGRLVYNYDTGVWPSHPAFNDRFIGKRYPLKQSWIGYFNDFPNGSVQNHGTHTLGTIAGLAKSTNDTIGVAFGSYWIANDFVTSTVQGLPPIVNMIEAFEWALNPDDDTATTSDIPDVINNSWRWYDGNDTIHCGGFVVNLMNAIEAVGIANIFSGGNSGPNNSTVNSPQRINTSEVNTFCVGSVNGNTTFPYSISNFSTRGPSQCPGSASLSIHPEVVAPGQNVRSAWDQNSYNTISGTSMAAPHVSGAVLLLKEAFPYLSGEDLLRALYLSAIDLGPSGEDNTYGMGMIDVFAAYQLLCQTNNPIVPNSLTYDIHLDSVTIPNFKKYTCLSSFEPTVYFSNHSDSTIYNIEFELKVNGDSVNTLFWSGNIGPNSSSSFTFPLISNLSSGLIEIQVIAKLGQGFNEIDYVNNSTITRFSKIKEITSLPFIEDFEHETVDFNWIIENQNLDKTWEIDSTSGLQWSHKSATVQLFSYAPRNNQKDGLISPKINLYGFTNYSLTFDLAYQKRISNALFIDTLKIFVSTNCGESYDYLVYEKHGDVLSTLDTFSYNFTPEYFTHWRNDTVDLTSFANENILIKFETTNRGGNNIYLDNIKVFEGINAPTVIQSIPKLDFDLYPNPASSLVNISCGAPNFKNLKINLYNSFGELLFNSQLNKKTITLSTEKLPSGIYFIMLSKDGRKITKSFMKW